MIPSACLCACVLFGARIRNATTEANWPRPRPEYDESRAGRPPQDQNRQEQLKSHDGVRYAFSVATEEHANRRGGKQNETGQIGPRTNTHQSRLGSVCVGLKPSKHAAE
ncbi:hypothetical protein ZHAS_00011075 [Anopheles sinensis]|uniref:Uncharacterized protein n=1 Tax=Anopheles sinensis TaxID=74873 RepID=A0A084VZ96_ANOSI|nr:hypothetical protein ZHAS_00011075 [Anopheles sinensis]